MIPSHRAELRPTGLPPRGGFPFLSACLAAVHSFNAASPSRGEEHARVAFCPVLMPAAFPFARIYGPSEAVEDFLDLPEILKAVGDGVMFRPRLVHVAPDPGGGTAAWVRDRNPERAFVGHHERRVRREVSRHLSRPSSGRTPASLEQRMSRVCASDPMVMDPHTLHLHVRSMSTGRGFQLNLRRIEGVAGTPLGGKVGSYGLSLGNAPCWLPA